MYLEKIQGPEDVKKLNVNEMQELAVEMRKALLTKLSKHGGHFEPNFGMVEATIAMHYVFDSPKDKIVYDVFLDRYDVQEVLTDNHLTKDQIVADITEVLALFSGR